MKLPKADEAWIHPDKLIKYLLSDTHEEGADKARFFKQFGFTVESSQVLASAFCRHAMENEVVRTVDAVEGTRYVIEGPLHAPDGRSLRVRTVWTIELGETTPRLITAYPFGG